MTRNSFSFVWKRGITGYRVCNVSIVFVVGVVRTCSSFTEVKKPEHALKVFVRFAIVKGGITYGLELMMALFEIVQGVISTIMNTLAQPGRLCRRRKSRRQ